MTEADAPTRHVRIGVDVGDVRVGVARSDRDGLLATPVATVPRGEAPAAIAALAEEVDAQVVMLGLPRSLDGHEGPAAQKVRTFCAELATALHTVGSRAEMRLVDERLTTVSAHQALHASGRKGRAHRAVVDQVAAVMILQQALDLERSSGRRAGAPVVPPETGQARGTDEIGDRRKEEA